MLAAIRDFSTTALKKTTTVERHLLDPPAKVEEPRSRWVRGSDGKWHEETQDENSKVTLDGVTTAQGLPHELHGQCYGFEEERNSWAFPLRTYTSEAAARPGYDTLDASEYLDQADVLSAKVTQLARLVTEARRCVVYAGAGLSTAAGIGDYATQSREAPEGGIMQSPLLAQPTLSHRVLVGLHRAGKLHRVLQQNHDGLPQKAGMPQEAVNEIHGALHAPDNPVVPMSGSLRQDLLEDMLELEAEADLVLAVGTTLAGMNADRVVHSCAARASVRSSKRTASPALAAVGSTSPSTVGGTVIIGLQRTKLDAECTLRIFAPCDKAFELLSKVLQLGELVPPPRAAGEYFTPPVLRRNGPATSAGAPEGIQQANYLLDQVGYDAMGRRARLGVPTNLDLREGVDVVIPSGMHAGAMGEVVGTDREGNVKVRMNLRVKKSSSFVAPMSMVVGTWWLQAAVDGTVPTLPVVNPPRDDDSSSAAAELRALCNSYIPAEPR